MNSFGTATGLGWQRGEPHVAEVKPHGNHAEDLQTVLLNRRPLVKAFLLPHETKR